MVVAGGGIAGLAAATSLARHGCEVLCIEPEPPPRHRVGESLDFSAPALLDEAGLNWHRLLRSGDATYKRGVKGVTDDGLTLRAVARPWLACWPLRFETTTLHVDRGAFDAQLLERAAAAGVQFEWDRVTVVDVDGDRVLGVVTRSGARHAADWFVDVSGRRRLIARRLGLAYRDWGAARVAVWSQSACAVPADETTIFLDTTSETLVWGWEIPISRHRVSVGAVMPLERFSARRRAGEDAATILSAELARYAGCRHRDFVEPVRSRVFQPDACTRATGANWLLVGESAALIDPLSSLGVTAALCHGLESAPAIMRALDGDPGASAGLGAYDQRVRRVTEAYNFGLEQLLYRPTVRRGLGMRAAGSAYVVLGFGINSLYSRMRLAERPTSVGLRVMLLAFRAWTRGWTGAAWATARIGRRSAAPARRPRRIPGHSVNRKMGSADERCGDRDP